MVVHSASRFMQRISKKQTPLQFHHSNYVCFDAYKANMCIQPSLTFKIWFRGLPKLQCFPYGQLPRVWVPQQVTYRTYLEYVHFIYLMVTNHAF